MIVCYLVGLILITLSDLLGTDVTVLDQTNQTPLSLIMLPLEQRWGQKLDPRVRRRLERESFKSLRDPRGSTEFTPLYQGFGVHYAFIWVGTPPQRVSVIVDTGSHHTAFPCTGCQCGKHYDPYWDPKKSKTSKVLKCGRTQCLFSQSYTEGSSWKAYKVRDVIWMGGSDLEMVKGANSWSFEFTFGCQSSETGLFRTQQVDGIMGMSAAEDTFPFQLYRNNITSTRAFAMCFRRGGGIMTLGGIDPRIHVSSMVFARMTKKNGWYTVKLLDISMVDKVNNQTHRINSPVSRYNEGKGTIVDSGTTDTYLPSAIRPAFLSLFHKLSGMSYHNKPTALTPKQLSMIPDLLFRFESLPGSPPITIRMPASSYLDEQQHGHGGQKGRFAFRLYLTEDIGVVLGANFMNSMNVLFDQDLLRVGFAPSDCKYERIPTTSTTATNTANTPPTPSNSLPGILAPKPSPPSSLASSPGCVDGQEGPITVCSARCSRTTPIGTTSPASPSSLSSTGSNSSVPTALSSTGSNSSVPTAIPVAPSFPPNTTTVTAGPNNKILSQSAQTMKAYVSSGEQLWKIRCSPASSDTLYKVVTGIPSEVADHGDLEGMTVTSRPCTVHCGEDHKILIGPYLDCPTSPWSECDGKCTQERTVGVRVSKGSSFKCEQKKENRACQVTRCPLERGDHLLALEMRIRHLDLALWSEGRKEDVMLAITTLFSVPEGSIREAAPPTERLGPWVKLHFRIRIRSTDSQRLLNEQKKIFSTFSPSMYSHYLRSGSSSGTLTSSSNTNAQSQLLDDDPSVSEEMKKSLFWRIRFAYSGSNVSHYLTSLITNSKIRDGEFIPNLITKHIETTSDWRWLRPDDIRVVQAVLTSVERANYRASGQETNSNNRPYNGTMEGGTMSMFTRFGALTPPVLGIPRTIWALGCTLSILFTSLSLFCVLYFSRRQGELRVGTKKEVTQIYLQQMKKLRT